ncbi:MAG: hypothetical protein JWP25_1447 [Bradyrhizobium sp.]|nr:hypothetical protein [Bradyrhizobium sp.]
MSSALDKPDPIVNPELPRIDQDKAVSPHVQEIEYALILQRMINTVQEDPAQMRTAIYQLARTRLKVDASWADEAEQQRLATALETAIRGVEDFSVRREDRERLPAPTAAAQIGQATAHAAHGETSAEALIPLTPAPEDILEPERTYMSPGFQPILDVRTNTLLSTLARFCVGILLFIAVVSLAYNKERLPLLGERLNLSRSAPPTVAKPSASPSKPDASQQAAADAKAADRRSNELPFPVPSDYGIYALNNGALSELALLPERVPDKRIAMSTPVNEPSRTTLPDGKARFILFRRDLAGNAPERVDVRAVARVVRALTFDAKGKPGYSPVTDAWNIRNVSYEFRVRPIAGNPEMLLVQSEKPDFALPAGRYILVLKDQGYDFTVAGKVTDLAQCLERTDAANGAFYSECQKP